MSSKGKVEERAPIPPGDVERGRRIFQARGSQCHRIVSESVGFVYHTLGPNLYGVVGSPIATADGPNERNHQHGFEYSLASKRAMGTIVWTREALDKFLENPRKFLPGTTMMFVGLKKAQERADVIAYLESQQDDGALQ